MALITCHECNKQYSSEAATCVHCGATNKDYVKPTSGCMTALLWTVGIVVVGFVILMMFGASISSTPEGKERSSERFAIEYCEDEYDKLKEDPRMTRGALAIAYGACEKMKDDFRAKWGREP